MSSVTRPEVGELADRLAAAVAELRRSDGWIEAMVTAARLHRYSFGNWLLLWSEAAERGTSVSLPAGYRTWQQLGRQVRRGEVGYRILAPLTRRVAVDENDPDAEGERRTVVTGFRAVTVFDISQTDGDPLPEVAPRLLAGDGNDRLTGVAVAMIAEAGYRFELAPLVGANGQTRPGPRKVTVERRLTGAQRTKTVVHELAHVLLHADSVDVACRGVVEVEAEAVAYVVCQAAGLDTSSYSVPYVAGWAQTTPDPDRALLAVGERVVTTARAVLDRLDASTTVHPGAPRETSHLTDGSDMMVVSPPEARRMSREVWS